MDGDAEADGGGGWKEEEVMLWREELALYGTGVWAPREGLIHCRRWTRRELSGIDAIRI